MSNCLNQGKEFRNLGKPHIEGFKNVEGMTTIKNYEPYWITQLPWGGSVADLKIYDSEKMCEDGNNNYCNEYVFQTAFNERGFNKFSTSKDTNDNEYIQLYGCESEPKEIVIVINIVKGTSKEKLVGIIKAEIEKKNAEETNAEEKFKISSIDINDNKLNIKLDNIPCNIKLLEGDKKIDIDFSEIEKIEKGITIKISKKRTLFNGPDSKGICDKKCNDGATSNGGTTSNGGCTELKIKIPEETETKEDPQTPSVSANQLNIKDNHILWSGKGSSEECKHKVFNTKENCMDTCPGTNSCAIKYKYKTKYATKSLKQGDKLIAYYCKHKTKNSGTGLKDEFLYEDQASCNGVKDTCEGDDQGNGICAKKEYNFHYIPTSGPSNTSGSTSGSSGSTSGASGSTSGASGSTSGSSGSTSDSNNNNTTSTINLKGQLYDIKLKKQSNYFKNIIWGVSALTLTGLVINKILRI